MAAQSYQRVRSGSQYHPSDQDVADEDAPYFQTEYERHPLVHHTEPKVHHVTTESQLRQRAGLREEKKEHTSSTDSKRQPRRSMVSDWWIELAAIVTSIAFLAAIIIVLLNIHDTPLANWQGPFGIQPTTLIAILITVCKLFLLVVVAEVLSQLKWVYFEQRLHRLVDIEHFDSASRGAFGAILFLVKIRWRAIVASCGALVMFLASAMEPFAQQSISFHPKTQAQTDLDAGVPFTKIYDLRMPYQGPLRSGGDFGGFKYDSNSLSKTYTAPMIGSMLSGLYNPNSTVTAPCGSTHCTWDEFETLGICASCEDITDSLKKNCTYDPIEHHFEYYNDNVHPKCIYTTPDGASLAAHCTGYAGMTDITQWRSSVKQYRVPPRIATVSSIAFSDDLGLFTRSCTEDPDFKFAKPAATQCTLSWCAKTFKTEKRKGALIENLVSWQDLNFPELACDLLGFQQIKWVFNPTLGLPSHTFPAFKGAPPPNSTLCSRDWLRNNTAFWIGGQDNYDYAWWLDQILTANDHTVGAGIFGQLLFSVNHANLTADMTGMAESMTNQMRMGPNMTMLDGKAWVTETYIRVNWPWLTFPIALVLIGSMFLIAGMVFSSQRSQVVWKSSSLAMLFHGLSGDGDGSSTRNVSDMKQAAKQIRAKLEEDDYGELKLVREPPVL